MQYVFSKKRSCEELDLARALKFGVAGKKTVRRVPARPTTRASFTISLSFHRRSHQNRREARYAALPGALQFC